jgi:hypothetical protein
MQKPKRDSSRKNGAQNDGVLPFSTICRQGKTEGGMAGVCTYRFERRVSSSLLPMT